MYYLFFVLTETFLPLKSPLKTLEYQAIFSSFPPESLDLPTVCLFEALSSHGITSNELLKSTCEYKTSCTRDDHTQKVSDTYWNVLTYDNQGCFDWRSLCCILSKRMAFHPYVYAYVVSCCIVGWRPVDSWWRGKHSFFTTDECNAHVSKEKFSK